MAFEERVKSNLRGDTGIPYDVTNKKAMTWEEYKNDLANGRSEKEFTLATRYTAVFNAHEVEGMPGAYGRETSGDCDG